jgi:hypothetical protein
MVRAAFALLALVSLVPALAAQRDPKEPPKPINLEQLNTANDEDDPHVSSSGLSLYYSSNVRKKVDILLSRRANQGQSWPAGKPLGDYIQSEADDRSVFVTAENRFPQYLYFATKKDKETKNFDIYVAVKQDRAAAFTSPTPLNTISSDADELHPWLSTNGRELYFSRKTKDGWRVFVASRKDVTGAAGFGEPKLLDLPPNFHHATLTPDGRTMYLQGPLEKGRSGLFRATRTATGWTKPEALDDLNNADGKTGDRSPCLTRDGFWLYFASDRPGGKGGLDLYMIRVSDLKTKRQGDKETRRQGD